MARKGVTYSTTTFFEEISLQISEKLSKALCVSISCLGPLDMTKN